LEVAKPISFEALEDAFVSNHEKAIHDFYTGERETFLRWAQNRFSVDHDTLLDVYQDAIISLYNRVLKKDYAEINSSPQAYLFGIARNLLLKKNLVEKRTLVTDNVFDFVTDIGENSITESMDKQHDVVLVQKALGKLQESCRTIIDLYYYRRYRLDAIREHLGYESTDVVKSRKYQCMKALKKIIAEIKL